MTTARKRATTVLRETGSVAGTARDAARTTARSTGRVAGEAARQARGLAERAEGLTGHLGGRKRRRVLGRARGGSRRRPALFLLGAGALGFAAVRLLTRARRTGAGFDAGPAGSTANGVPGTASGQPTAGVEVADAGGVRTGTALPEPYPEPTSGGPLFGTTSDGGYLGGGTDEALGSADFSGARHPRG